MFKDDCSAKGHRIWLEIRGFYVSRRIYYSSAFAFFFNLKNRKKQTTYLMPMMHMSFLKLNSTISYLL
jgi:hypothetical protein